VSLVAAQAISGSEVDDRAQDLVLEPLAPFEVCFLLSERGQEVADESRHGRIALGCDDTSPAVVLVI
jgi:hypothetical protein